VCYFYNHVLLLLLLLLLYERNGDYRLVSFWLMPELVLNFGSYIYFLFLQSDPPWSDDGGAILQERI
jgi:ABC-type uncharacterized transport system YnjBCD permease subunit